VIRFLALFLLAGCVSGNYTRLSVNEPVDEAVVAALPAGVDLQVCLGRLGAPIRVWETEAGRYAMAYGWLRDRGWGVKVSYSFAQFVPSASFAFDSALKKMSGAVLWFDGEMKLVEAKTGLLSDLLPPRRRPVDVDLLEELKQEQENAERKS
jgi:hypothetical protein